MPSSLVTNSVAPFAGLLKSLAPQSPYRAWQIRRYADGGVPTEQAKDPAVMRSRAVAMARPVADAEGSR